MQRQNRTVTAISLLEQVLLAVVVSTTITVIASESVLGRTIPITKALGQVKERFWPLVGALIIVGIVFFVLALILALLTELCGLSALLFLFLLYYGLALYFFTIPVMVLERTGPRFGVSRAQYLGRERFWPSLGFVFVIWLVMGIIQLAFGSASWLVGDTTLEGASALRTAISLAVTVFVTPIMPVGLTLLYYDARIRVEGLDFALQVMDLPEPRPADVESPEPTVRLIALHDLINMFLLAAGLFALGCGLYVLVTVLIQCSGGLTLAKRVAALVLTGVWLCLTTAAAAQYGTIGEADFWQRLTLTAALLDGSSAQAIPQVNALWSGVDSVRLPDETVIPVDVDWLRPPPANSAVDLTEVRDRVQAMLDFHARYPGGSVRSADDLAKLDALLRQPAPETSTQAVSSGDSGSSELLSPSLSQMIMLLAAVIVVAGLLIYLGRMLQVQPAAVDLDAETVPGSSQAATARAEELKAVNDYRAAIRQLYLASLLALDEQRIIRFDATLTNREHLDQLRDQPRLRELMSQVVTIFDRVWYGFAPADEALYRSFRQVLDQLRQSGR